jgi:hypothetical protein
LLIATVTVLLYDDTGAVTPAGALPTVTTAYVNKLSASGDSWLLGGEVGIGTATPTVALDVVGSIRASGSITLGSNELTISQSGFSVSVPQLHVAGVTAFNGAPDGTIGLSVTAGAGTSRAAVFNAASAASADIIQVYGSGSVLKFNVAANGDTGIGATTPTAKLDVVGTIAGRSYVYLSQPAPAAVDATATVTVANLQARIITSTSAAAVTATLPTGTLMDGLYAGALDMGYDWTIINTGPSTVTVAAGVDHTVVGGMAVATATSANFRSRRTAANVWVTYRV